MNFDEIERILKDSLTDPRKQKTLPIQMQNIDWNFYNFDSRIISLIRHFAYWLSIECRRKKHENNYK